MSDKTSCPPFPIVPRSPLCGSDTCAPLSLCRMPRKYPLSMLEDVLQSAYTLTEVDFNNAFSIAPDILELPADGGGISTQTNACAPATLGTKYYYSYINSIIEQEKAAKRKTPWVLNADQRICDEGYTGITKGPSFISLLHNIEDSVVNTMLPNITIPPYPVVPTIPDRFTGTKIPRPKGECDGTWNLTYQDGRLKWVCDSQDIFNECSSLSIKNAYISLELGGSEVAEITIDDILNGGIPYVCVEYEYEGFEMPEVAVELTLATSKTDAYKKPCATASWINHPFPSISTTIGPLLDESNNSYDDEYMPILRGVTKFQFNISAEECFKIIKADEDGTSTECDYSDVTIAFEVKVPDCPDIEPVTGSIELGCTVADGELSVSDWWITDKLGYALDGPSIGTSCDEVRGGEYFIVVEYANNTNTVYLSDENSTAEILTTTEGVKASIGKNGAPNKLYPGDSEERSFPFIFELLPNFCGGSVTIQLPGVQDTIEIPINGGCTECPSFKLVSLNMKDKASGSVLNDGYVWEIGCAAAASKEVIIEAVFAAQDELAGYTNWDDKDSIELTTTGTSDGITVSIADGVTLVVPNIPKGEGKTSSVSIGCLISTNENLKAVEKPGEISGSVEFSVASEESEAPSCGINISRHCGVFTIERCEGIRWKHPEETTWHTSDEKITKCAPGTYILELTTVIHNTSYDYITHTFKIQRSASAGGAAKIVNKEEEEIDYTITNAAPMRGYSLTYHVTVAVEGDEDDDFEWWAALEINIPEYSIKCSGKIAAEPNCGGSSSYSSGSGSGDPCDGDPNCCQWLETSDDRIEIGKNTSTGRCTIKLADDIFTPSSCSQALSVDLCALVKDGLLVGDEDGINVECIENGVVKITNTAPGVTYKEGSGIKINEGAISIDEDWLSNWLATWFAAWIKDNTQPCE